MADIQSPSQGTTPPGEYPFAFRGTGGEFFGIWIVNLALTVLTLGIYSAWAKVRTRRYFYGNTYVAGHAFDYHASPIRILIGRAIALVLFIGYTLSASASPTILSVWLIAFVILVPWLVNAALRFNARNSSYRNIRLNFTGTYFGALKAFILWPLLGLLSLFLAWPLAHRARNYFYVNHHTYGGKPFSCSYPGWDIYQVYIVSWLILIAVMIAIFVITFMVFDLEQLMTSLQAMEENPEEAPTGLFAIAAAFYGILLVVFIATGTYVRTMTFNLAVDNTQIDKRHWLDAKLNPFVMIWIVASNLFLIFLTLGFFYPWARVRIARYTANKMTLFGREGLDAYTAQLASEQTAIGEEVASFFDIDIGL